MPQSTSSSSLSRIHKLSPLLINQLAAGEVVTRPASVVKELIDNAMDAGASEIDIHITQGGMAKIEVSDNGVGIHPEDMFMAVTRHATSKIADVEQLQGVTTLGFRGEALASIAAVSRLTLSSCHNASGIGRQLSLSGVLPEQAQIQPVVRSRGTTVCVQDLYFNVPGRRGNLKSIATEFAHIENVVIQAALSRCDVQIRLLHEHKQRLLLPATSHQPSESNDVSHRLQQVLPISLPKLSEAVSVDLTPLLDESQSLQPQGSATISGLVWATPKLSDSTPHQVGDSKSDTVLPRLIYVNGRRVDEAMISRQIRQLAQGYHQMQLGYVLYLQLPVNWVDANVHPSKQRIRIHQLANILVHLRVRLTDVLARLHQQLVSQHNGREQQYQPEPAAQPICTAPPQPSSQHRSAPYRYHTSPCGSLPHLTQVQSHQQRYGSTDDASTYLLSPPSPQPAVPALPVPAVLPVCLSLFNEYGSLPLIWTTANPTNHLNLAPAAWLLPWMLLYLPQSTQSQQQLLCISALNYQQTQRLPPHSQADRMQRLALVSYSCERMLDVMLGSHRLDLLGWGSSQQPRSTSL